jgi:hypothetical protein
MTFDDILKLIRDQRNREYVRGIGQRYYDIQVERGRADSTGLESRQKKLLNEIMHHIHLQYRAIRRPLPTENDVREMIFEHFKH